MNRAVMIVVGAALSASALAEPQDLDVFTDFEEFSPNTIIGDDIVIGVSPQTATFTGPGQFAGRIGDPALYHSGVRSWMSLEQSESNILFETLASDVQFYARMDPIANGNAILTAFDANGDQIGATETIVAGDEFRLITYTGDIARINVINNATNVPDGMFAIDDFGFSVVPAPSTLALLTGLLACSPRRRR